LSIADRIYQDIETRIRSGEWKPGDRIPYEQQLAADYRCARATANKAVSRLASEGLVERRRRAGSFVAQPHLSSAILGVPDIAALVADRGEAYRWELTSRAHGPAPAEVTQGESDRWLRLTGVHFAGAAPFGWERRWIDLDIVPEAESVDFSTSPAGSWLLSRVAWAKARHRIRAVPADREAARRLLVAPATPCIQIERWTWAHAAQITYVRQLFPGDRYDLIEDFGPSLR
jgi:GntR family transcriptional regulator, histidine utilization repressor